MPTFQIETLQFRFDHSRTAFTPFYEALFDETAFDLSPEYWGFEEPIDESLSKDDPKKDLLDRWKDAHPLTTWKNTDSRSTTNWVRESPAKASESKRLFLESTTKRISPTI